MFIDKVKLRVIAGKGGNGAVAWHREKFIPKGGPAGGNGGPGGSVILRTESRVLSLESYRYCRTAKAENGLAGSGNRRQGRRGRDEVLSLPCGTLVKDGETGALLADLTEPGQEVVLCAGGRGGRGNASFKSARHRAPNWCTQGTEGEQRRIELELKLIADVGLVGFPNAGKSTFLNQITRLPVKIAPYPFTTLRPNLGLIEFEDYSRLLIADIPGIIAGAHQNRGLGFEFLRHIERTRVLVFLLDASGIEGRTPADDYEVLLDELRHYDADLLDRPSLVMLNKIDCEEAAEQIQDFRQRHHPTHLFEVSALEGTGIEAVLKQLYRFQQKLSPKPMAAADR